MDLVDFAICTEFQRDFHLRVRYRTNGIMPRVFWANGVVLLGHKVVMFGSLGRVRDMLWVYDTVKASG